ncbi:MAG: hypothetical protein K0S53_947 [Bacteroidetes bacterium]|jgi:hypothetical protein|nr:hypothetical protein [Bacteroidota bacterium]MDF2450642.1 hypothetical protein [Bacteroidota bacterium]
MVSESKKITTHNFELEVHEDGYYLIRIFGDDEFTVDDLKILVKGQKELGAKLIPSLVLCAEQASTNIDLLNTLAKKAFNPYSVADAFVLSSMSQRILANFYIKINKPERPTRFFNEPETALIWLKDYLAS